MDTRSSFWSAPARQFLRCREDRQAHLYSGETTEAYTAAARPFLDASEAFGAGLARTHCCSRAGASIREARAERVNLRRSATRRRRSPRRDRQAASLIALTPRRRSSIRAYLIDDPGGESPCTSAEPVPINDLTDLQAIGAHRLDPMALDVQGAAERPYTTPRRGQRHAKRPAPRRWCPAAAPPPDLRQRRFQPAAALVPCSVRMRQLAGGRYSRAYARSEERSERCRLLPCEEGDGPAHVADTPARTKARPEEDTEPSPADGAAPACAKLAY